MQFLADECVSKKTVDFLRRNDYKVITAYELNLSGASDETILKKAKELNYIFLTCDSDFVNIMLYPPIKYNGIVYLKFSKFFQERVHHVLLKALNEINPVNLLVIIDENKYRVQR